ncbi:MAG: vWA domain-containing protein [Ancrocorticia sp.]|uniref:vWA domain-containing protein n=1 Tax=Ancrocorticia sp. TaxID=2593684 RepID=UPI003F90494D
MRLIWIWPLWVVLIIALAGLCVCWLGWRDVRRREGAARIWGRRGLMVLAVAALGAGPAVATELPQVETNVEVYVVVDTTGSMGAEDYNGTNPRTDGVRADITAIAGSYPGARFSVIRFDSEATVQLPLTTDVRAVQSWVETFQLEYAYGSSGSSVNRASGLLTDTLKRSAEERPENIRAVYFFSDGEATDQAANLEVEFSEAGNYTSGGAVLGYGTEEGGRMRVSEGGSSESYIQDPATGDDAISRIDEIDLGKVAERLGVPYVHRTQPGIDNSVLLGGIEDLQDQLGSGHTYNPVLWPIALVMVALAIWEIVDVVPRVRGAFEARRGMREGANGVGS